MTFFSAGVSSRCPTFFSDFSDGVLSSVPDVVCDAEAEAADVADGGLSDEAAQEATRRPAANTATARYAPVAAGGAALRSLGKACNGLGGNGLGGVASGQYRTGNELGVDRCLAVVMDGRESRLGGIPSGAWSHAGGFRYRHPQPQGLLGCR